MTETIEAYPLQWPHGRERSRTRASSRFRIGWQQSMKELQREVQLLGGRDLIISTNLPLRNDGLPYAQQRRIDDPGVAVYFKRKARQVCFACDRWASIADNIHAIALTIAALRGIERWGTGDMVEAAFTGFAALPNPAADAFPWSVLGVRQDATIEEIETAYRRSAAVNHPDRGGSTERMAQLNNARDTMLARNGRRQ